VVKKDALPASKPRQAPAFGMSNNEPRELFVFSGHGSTFEGADLTPIQFLYFHVSGT
jgi:hypothetical protein